MGRGQRRIYALAGLAFSMSFAASVDFGGDGLRLQAGRSALAEVPNAITIISARQGCLRVQPPDNVTLLVAEVCNGLSECGFQSPGPLANSATEPFCTQGLEISFRCTNGDSKVVTVPGDAWNHGPAQLICDPATLPIASTDVPNVIKVVTARQGCLDIQPPGNMTTLVGRACNGLSSCSFKSPGQQPGSATRLFCTQGMEITYECTDQIRQVVSVPGDAWKHGPAQLTCDPPVISSGPPPDLTPVPPDPDAVGAIKVVEARQGCLDIQPPGNMTVAVGQACDGLISCDFKAPNGTQPGSVTRPFCTQQLEIFYTCGGLGNTPYEVTTQPVPGGDAWKKPPLRLECPQLSVVATNTISVAPTTAEPNCRQPVLGPPSYFLPPSNMLDWTPTVSKGDFTFTGFRPPEPAAIQADYTTGIGPVKGYPGAPGSVMGANEGRLRIELRDVAVQAAKDPISVLCQAAAHFTRDAPSFEGSPSDLDFGNAFADLTVTGRAAFSAFILADPSEENVALHPDCVGSSPSAMSQALDRAYAVATALRMAHDSPERQALGWIAVSGEDDQPYLPVDVPGTEGPGRPSFPLFHIQVTTEGIAVTARYMIAHANPPVFPPQENLAGTGGRVIPDEPLPALAPDAEVILFIHGLDSRLEEALDLTDALHRLPGHNWTVISMDLPSSGYTDNIDNALISPLSAIKCHSTPGLDFLEDFVVEFVNALDRDLHGQLKPRIRAVVGGSLGGNLAFRLGRRDNLLQNAGLPGDTPWITAVVPWSPASIWTSFASGPGVFSGCDTGFDLFHPMAVSASLNFAAADTDPVRRREYFYGSFEWDEGDVVAIFSPDNHKPQAQCWFSDNYACKQQVIRADRLDRQETYDDNFRSWHWRLAGEQLVFSHQQNRVEEGPRDPVYMHNTKPTLLFSGQDDKCASLGADTVQVAGDMTDTPGFARSLVGTGHSLDNEHPNYIASEIAQFLDSTDGAMSTEPNMSRVGGDYSVVQASSFGVCREDCSEQPPCEAYSFAPTDASGAGTCHLEGTVSPPTAEPTSVSGVKHSL